MGSSEVNVRSSQLNIEYRHIRFYRMYPFIFTVEHSQVLLSSYIHYILWYSQPEKRKKEVIILATRIVPLLDL